jgi:hypothetical protein
MTDKARPRKLKLFRVSSDDKMDGWEVIWAYDRDEAFIVGAKALGRHDLFYPEDVIKVTQPRGFRVRDYNPPSEPGVLKESSRKVAVDLWRKNK